MYATEDHQCKLEILPTKLKIAKFKQGILHTQWIVATKLKIFHANRESALPN